MKRKQRLIKFTWCQHGLGTKQECDNMAEPGSRYCDTHITEHIGERLCEFRTDGYVTTITCLNQAVGYSNLCAKHDSLKNDKARLDWLNLQIAAAHDTDYSKWSVEADGDSVHDIREAIDRMMKKDRNVQHRL